jgi:hypothetical protein
VADKINIIDQSPKVIVQDDRVKVISAGPQGPPGTPINLNDLLDVDAPTPNNQDGIFFNTTSGKWETEQSPGEGNTASNVGTAGVGLFDGKVVVDLQFRKANPLSNRLSIALDAPNQKVDFDVIEGNIVHQNLSGAGTNTHAAIDTHIADSTIHFTKASISHTEIQDIGTNTHAQIDSHIADGSIHYPQTAIDHVNLINKGINTHAQIDSHIADASIHFTEASIDHGSIQGLGDDDHTQYSLADGSRPFTGAVGGVTPIAGADLATKDYVDGLIQGLDWQESVKSFLDLTTAEPVSPTLGDRYINTVTGTSNITAQSVTANNVYEWNGSSWTESVTNEGFAAWVEDQDVVYVFNGAAWVKFGTTVTHNNTTGKQGGTANEYYHLTEAQHDTLTDGSDASSLHNHDTWLATKTLDDLSGVNLDFPGTQQFDVLSFDFAGPSGPGFYQMDPAQADLAQLSGSVFSGDISFSNNSTLGLSLNRLTETERDAISVLNDGPLIFNTTTSKVNVRAGFGWVDLLDSRTLTEDLADGFTVTSGRSSSILDGGNVTIAGVNTVNVLAGVGQIIKHASFPGTVDGTDGKIEWPDFNNYVITGVGSVDRSYLYIDDTGQLQQQTTAFTDDEKSTRITLVELVHPVSVGAIVEIIPRYLPGYDEDGRDMREQLLKGNKNYGGFFLSASGSDNDALNMGSGKGYIVGFNHITDRKNADIVSQDGIDKPRILNAYKLNSGSYFVEDAIILQAGTASITTGSPNLTGVGTTFTAYSPGQYILISDTSEFLKILSITDDTNLIFETNAANTATNSAFSLINLTIDTSLWNDINDPGNELKTISGSNDRATNHRFYIRPSDDNTTLGPSYMAHYYGQIVYNSQAEALGAINDEPTDEFPSLQDSTIFVGWMTMTKGGDVSTAQFTPAPRLRNQQVVASGGVPVGAIVDGDFSASGLMTRVAPGVYTSRTIQGTVGQVNVVDGDGVGGDPTISIDPSGIPHNSLGSLQGGQANEYYHLTAAQHADLGGLGTFTEGSVIFAGVGGALDEDNSGLFWDNILKELLVGGDVGIGTSGSLSESVDMVGDNRAFSTKRIVAADKWNQLLFYPDTVNGATIQSQTDTSGNSTHSTAGAARWRANSIGHLFSTAPAGTIFGSPRTFSDKLVVTSDGSVYAGSSGDIDAATGANSILRIDATNEAVAIGSTPLADTKLSIDPGTSQTDNTRVKIFGNDFQPQLEFRHASNNSSRACVFLAIRGRGTDASAPPQTLSGDRIFRIASLGYDQNDVLQGSGSDITIEAAENITNIARGMRMKFSVAKIGETALTDILTLFDGNAGIDGRRRVGDTDAPVSRIESILDDGSLTTEANFSAIRYGNPGAGMFAIRAEGSKAAPTALTDGRNLFFFGVRGYDGTAFTTSNQGVLRFRADGNWTGTSWGAKADLEITPQGSTLRQTVWEAIGDDFKFTSIPNFPSYTVAGVPAAALRAGSMIYVTDESGGAVPAFSDGVNWRRVTDRAIVS